MSQASPENKYHGTFVVPTNIIFCLHKRRRYVGPLGLPYKGPVSTKGMVFVLLKSTDGATVVLPSNVPVVTKRVRVDDQTSKMEGETIGELLSRFSRERIFTVYSRSQGKPRPKPVKIESIEAIEACPGECVEVYIESDIPWVEANSFALPLEEKTDV